MPCGIDSVCETDLLENEIGDVQFDGNVLKLNIGANEIKTLKFAPRSG